MKERIAIKAVGAEELGQCPAAVAVGRDGNAVLLLNRGPFRRLSPFGRRFVVCHELGHWLLATGDERLADAFALGLLHGTEPRSLKGCLAPLAAMNITPRRMASLYRLCLMVDRGDL